MSVCQMAPKKLRHAWCHKASSYLYNYSWSMPWLMFSRGSRPLCAGLVACYWGANPRGPGDQPWHIGNEVPLPMTLKESVKVQKKLILYSYS
jgi:hypothetical protein